jgi:TRAP-type C4-dicarboxylate transport system substrate-binding protein
MWAFVRFAIVALMLAPVAVRAEPIKLKLAFFSSDRTHLYRSIVKPFIDAVNAEGRGLVEIEPYLSGKLGGDPAAQSRLVFDGTADIVYVVVPYEQKRFPDTAVIELPGLFADAREATLAFTRLVENGTIRDFRDFYVIGAVGSQPESIHLRPAVSSLADLKGKRVRANNDTEIAVMKRLGMMPMFVPLPQTADAISSGQLDGAFAPPVPMVEFGIGRVTAYHYMLGTSSVPLMLVMSRKRFDALPPGVQALIKKYSGVGLALQTIQIDQSSTDLIMNQIQSDPKRKVIFPSAADMLAANAVFRSIVDSFAAGDPYHVKLIDAVRMETAKLRTEN